LLHAILVFENGRYGGRSTDVSNVIIRKPRTTIGRSDNDNLSTLPNHIGHVVPLRAKKQVIRVHACRSIAFVTDADVLGEFSVRNPPQVSMRRDKTISIPK
jgi:hypothetical protein